MRYISRSELKSLKADEGLKKSYISTPQDVGNRQIKFVVSTSTPDRSNDVIKTDGWILDSYRSNPVVLWGHDADRLPIGKCVFIGVEANELRAIVEFVPQNIPVAGEIAEAVYQLCKQGYLSATSVGFKSKNWKETDDPTRGAGTYSAGADFETAELMEFSIVNVPDNVEALIVPDQQINGTISNTKVDPAKSVKLTIEKQRRQRLMDILARR